MTQWQQLMVGRARDRSAVFPVTQWRACRLRSSELCTSAGSRQAGTPRNEARHLAAPSLKVWESLGREGWKVCQVHDERGRQRCSEGWTDSQCLFEFICFYKDE